MGNFFNSEIIGKQVDPNSPFAILFPQQSSEYGITVPRYPSQLFEAIGYVLYLSFFGSFTVRLIRSISKDGYLAYSSLSFGLSDSL
jgi:prolipoprotein diacylglyceryltransferase